MKEKEQLNTEPEVSVNERPYLETAEAVLSRIGSAENGLSSAEAARRLEANGPNKLVEAKKRSNILRLFD